MERPGVGVELVEGLGWSGWVIVLLCSCNP